MTTELMSSTLSLSSMRIFLRRLPHSTEVYADEYIGYMSGNVINSRLQHLARANVQRRTFGSQTGSIKHMPGSLLEVHGLSPCFRFNEYISILSRAACDSYEHQFWKLLQMYIAIVHWKILNKAREVRDPQGTLQVFQEIPKWVVKKTINNNK